MKIGLVSVLKAITNLSRVIFFKASIHLVNYESLSVSFCSLMFALPPSPAGPLTRARGPGAGGVLAPGLCYDRAGVSVPLRAPAWGVITRPGAGGRGQGAGARPIVHAHPTPRVSGLWWTAIHKLLFVGKTQTLLMGAQPGVQQ